MTIDWVAFLIVLGSALGASLVAVSLFAVGVRLLATPGPNSPAAAAAAAAEDPEESGAIPREQRPRLATVAAVPAFALAAAVAVTGVVLIVH